MPRKKSVGDGGSAAQKHTLEHCRTQSVLQRRGPHRSHLARPLRRVQLTKIRQPRIGIWLSRERKWCCAHSHVILWPGVECIFEAHRWVNTMDSEANCGNWWGFSQSGWWWKSKDYSLQSSLGRIRQERRHLGAHHTSTGIYYHGQIELSYISARYSTQGSKHYNWWSTRKYEQNLLCTVKASCQAW